MSTVFLQGLQMFSDVGINASIIQSKHSDDPEFLNTAWTTQVIRGCSLWVCTLAVAWPLSVLYKQPIMAQLLPAIGLNALLAGFNSTSLATENRALRLKRIAAIEIASQTLSIAAMIGCAWISPTVWALAAGGIVSAAAKCVLSHVALPGIRNRFRWDSPAARELFRFGRWIFISTAFTFLTGQGDRLVLSTFVPIREIGIYSVAVQLSQVGREILMALSSRVLFPLYSRVMKEEPNSLRPRIRKVRLILLAAIVPIPALLTVFGGSLVRVLYAEPYWEAGWILRLLSIGAIAEVLTLTISPVVLASGDSFRHMVLLVVRGSLFTAAMTAGAALDGTRGLVIALATAQWLAYPVLVWAIRETKTWLPWLDLGVLFYSGTWFLMGSAASAHLERYLRILIGWARALKAS